jgi:hypothetical protein
MKSHPLTLHRSKRRRIVRRYKVGSSEFHVLECGHERAASVSHPNDYPKYRLCSACMREQKKGTT